MTSNQAVTGRSARQVTHIRGQRGPACSTFTRTLNASIMVPVEDFATAANKCTRCEKRHAKLLRLRAVQQHAIEIVDGVRPKRCPVCDDAACETKSLECSA